MKKTLIAALLAGMSFGALAVDYYVVVPVKNRVASAATAPEVTVALSDYTLPTATAGQAYNSFSFGPLLSVTGDASFTGAGVAWELAAGALPAGVELNATTGALAGTPAQTGAASFEVKATYKAKSAQRAYALQVAGLGISIQTNGVRAWANGSLAQSCYDYRFPSDGVHSYTGDAASGPYQIAPSGEIITAYCDMDSDGGGWTLVARIVGTGGTHVDRGAVGVLVSQAQPTAAKLSDAVINSITREAMRVSSDANPTVVTNFHKWNPTIPFNATSSVSSGNRDTKAVWTAAWTTPTQNSTPYFYYGFKAFRGTVWMPSPGINYGYGSATGVAARNGMEVTGRGWNQAGHIWVR